MSLIGQIAIAMGIDVKAFKKGLAGARASLNGFASNVTTIGLGVTAFGATAAVAIGKVVTSASNLQEQADRVVTHFGAGAPKILDFADTIGTAFGLAKSDILASTASFETFFSNAGYAEDAVADLSIAMTRLGTDIARDINLPTQQALVKLKSGLAGEAEAIRQLGVSMLEANINAYAYQKGIAKVGAELTEYQKIKTRTAYLTDKFKKSEDNLAKTGDKVAGAIEAVKGRFENLSATIGDSLLLTAAPALGEVQIGLQALQASWVAVGDTAIGSSSATIEGLDAEHHTIGTLQSAIGNIADSWQIVGQTFRIVQGGITAGIWSIVGTLGALEKGIKILWNSMSFGPFGNTKKMDVNNTFFGAWEENLKIELAKMQGEVVKAQEAPWASEVVNKAFAKGRADIGEARKKLAAIKKPDILGIKQGLDPSAALGKHAHQGFAHAAEFGSAEATNIILASTYGSPKLGGAAEKTAENTAKTNVLLEQIIRKSGAGAAAGAIKALDAF